MLDCSSGSCFIAKSLQNFHSFQRFVSLKHKIKPHAVSVSRSDTMPKIALKKKKRKHCAEYIKKKLSYQSVNKSGEGNRDTTCENKKLIIVSEYLWSNLLWVEFIHKFPPEIWGFTVIHFFRALG